MKKIDMSSEAITRRLQKTDQLRKLSLSLMKARKPTPEEAEQFRREREENERRMAEKQK